MEPEIAEVCVGFWSCISPDAWLTAFGTLFGAFLGAFLAGRFTLMSVQKQLKNNDLLRRKQEILSHLKVSTDIIVIARVVRSQCNELLEYLESNMVLDDHFDKYSFNLAKNCASGLDKEGERIKMINYHLVPYESYNGYSAARETVLSLRLVVHRIYDDLLNNIRINQMESSKNFKALKKYLSDLDTILQILEKVKSNEENEYDEIKLKINKK